MPQSYVRTIVNEGLKLPSASFGLFALGHSGSSAVAGSVRGTHIGKPVAERIVGFSGSKQNLSSKPPVAEFALPCTPVGSLMRTLAPVPPSISMVSVPVA
jgi:hypothetical protein